MDDKKKKYEKPELNIVYFNDDMSTDDVISQSLTDGGSDPGFGVGEQW